MNISVVVAAVISFIVTAVMGKYLIPYLIKLKYGQTILEIGPSWHKNKQGTPTMGGIMFIIGIVAAVLVGVLTMLILGEGKKGNYHLNNLKLFSGLVMALLFGALGFVDDYVKVVKKRNLGLTAKQKMLFQILIAVVYLLINFIGGDRNTWIYFPFIASVNFGFLYYPFAIFLIVGFVNAVNLTDGIDGLAATVTFVVGTFMLFISSILNITSMGVLAGALAGGCLGFLIYNFHPAKVFMGDTGSMFLGGIVVALAFGIRQPLFLLLCGIIYLAETGSVMLQVAYFKLTHGKRIFKMSPIHHHFEMSGWSEEKIVAVFSLVTAVGCILAVLAIVLI